jgi:hypothetical protein
MMHIHLNKYNSETETGDSGIHLHLDVCGHSLTFRKNGVVVKSIPMTLKWSYNKTLELMWYIDPSTGTVYICQE